MVRKLTATLMVLAVVLSVALAIDWEPELQDDLYRQQAWADYYHKWHDLPSFGPDGRWNVERNFDHAAHWKWQMQEIERLYGDKRTPMSGAGPIIGVVRVGK